MLFLEGNADGLKGLQFQRALASRLRFFAFKWLWSSLSALGYGNDPSPIKTHPAPREIEMARVPKGWFHPWAKKEALRGMVPSPAPKRDRGDPQAFRLRSEGLDDDGSGRGT